MSQVKTHVFKVDMSCDGCCNAVSNVLNKNKDNRIIEFNVDLPSQKVTIKSSMTTEELAEILKKTGKNVTYSGPN